MIKVKSLFNYAPAEGLPGTTLTLTDLFAVYTTLQGDNSELHIQTFMKDSKGKRQIMTTTFYGPETFCAEQKRKLLWHINSKWVQDLPQDDNEPLLPPKRKVLIIQNPFSGNGAATRNLATAQTML